MLGTWLVNHDTQQVSYDFSINVPFVGFFMLTRQHLETAQKYLDGSQKEMTGFETHQLDGIHIKNLAFAELPALIEKTKLLTKDLEELLAKSQEAPGV